MSMGSLTVLLCILISTVITVSLQKVWQMQGALVIILQSDAKVRMAPKCFDYIGNIASTWGSVECQ